MAKERKSIAGSPSTSAATAEDHGTVVGVPNQYEYSISNIELVQGVAPVGGTANHAQPLQISGIASPESNACAVHLQIYRYVNGSLQQYQVLVTVACEPGGVFRATISAGVLAQLAGSDIILEFTANGPDFDTTPAAYRPVHIS